MERIKKDVIDEKDEVIIIYYNEKRLNFCIFFNLIKDDLLENISKNRVIINKEIKKPISFYFNYYRKNEEYDEDNNDCCCGHSTDINFGINGISVDYFVKDILNNCNKIIYYTIYVLRKFFINRVDKKFIIYSFEVSIMKNQHMELHKEKFCKSLHDELIKEVHKRKFHKDLHNELMLVAWHPKRVVDWCYDIEEQEIYNSLPDE